ncbi:2-C-methyl-D-erythritol 4-phosphate cytidylyltransferase [Methylotenera sp.]|uniref:2-C-methyl-D-erythritol 4-phosphate cytidylyltransferase n=1 Tax=Methylotenera sp. TaxID=2051956 RepID=UPI002727956F|nr:2-C-methyl-D-erythritol 4-phosphate cytidylyltransferase [Methylotenera sp.]MDO9203815.1 2-C-methyl-D-erythritol 4-phosphate cytidylyltransferase [Methylotenera sp.]MDP2072079.1 2-C-methyl-D-erythritol 4-phosphate cytidylyltransferase [Methylotenera sp.]MDP3006911.1 2-C-methyl-D-erythritol 4-phosphate cytidylyltransferase [Methylotenera sp.]MDP3007152.1 2-C-methyl-D-erythritol 4-phosphate cytidylyltransferase [Methylotenera sp.]MDP3818996.1 2-C-methyl-D-erythritol 4-phosphate cytidylyltrans
MARFHVIIPAAGNGSRMGAEAPKQYLNLHGKTLIQHVIKVFDQSTKINTIHVLLNQEDAHWRSTYLHSSSKLQVHYCGGDTRANTVLNGLIAIENQVEADDWILVHDAARPGLSNRLLNHLLSMLENDDVGGLLAMPLADTLKRADSEQRVSATIPRNDLWQAQTPQMFRYATLKKALIAFGGSPTDEAEAIEALGLKPKLVIGELQNLKVTYPQDLAVLSALFSSS